MFPTTNNKQIRKELERNHSISFELFNFLEIAALPNLVAPPQLMVNCLRLTANCQLTLESVSGRNGISSTIADIVMTSRNIFIVVFSIQQIFNGKLHAEVFCELVVSIQI